MREYGGGGTGEPNDTPQNEFQGGTPEAYLFSVSPKTDQPDITRPPQYDKPNLAAIRRQLADLGRELGSVQAELGHQHEVRPPAAEQAAAQKFGRLFAKLVDGWLENVPVANRWKGHLHISKRTYYGYRDGTRLPRLDHLDQMIEAAAKVRGRPAEASELADVREALTEALQARSPRSWLEAANQETAECIEAGSGHVARLGALQQVVTSVMEQLTALVSSGSVDPDAQKRQLKLLRRLVRAHEAVKDILARQEENHNELRKCAQELVQAVARYLREDS